MLAEVVRSTSGNAGPVVLFCDAEDSEAHPGIVASFFGVSEIPYYYEGSPPPQPQRGGVVGTKTSEPCREPRRRASPTGLPADPAGAPCRAGVCRRPGALRHCPPVVGSAAINASLPLAPLGCFTAFGLHPPAMPGACASSRLSRAFAAYPRPLGCGIPRPLTAFRLQLQSIGAHAFGICNMQGVKGETGSRTRSAARRASTERVRVSSAKRWPLMPGILRAFRPIRSRQARGY